MTRIQRCQVMADRAKSPISEHNPVSLRLSASKTRSPTRRSSGFSYLQVPLEVDEIQAGHSSAEEGGRGSDYGTDKEETDCSAPILNDMIAKKKSVSTPTLVSGIGPKKRSFPKLLPSEEFQRLLEGLPAMITRRKSTPAQGLHRKSDTQVSAETREKLELVALKPHSSNQEVHHSSKTQLNDEAKQASSLSATQQRTRDDEEKVLEALREVVRKCTNPDTTKRPSAAETYEMLLNVYM